MRANRFHCAERTWLLAIIMAGIGLMLMLVLPVATGPVRAAQKQTADPVSSSAWLEHFKHVPIPTDTGAPADIEDLGQAPNGDLWIAGTRGLFRFDGLNFLRFTAIGPNQLRSDMIYAMYVTRKGNVWVGYYGGGVSLIVNGQVHDYSDGVPKGPLKQLVEDARGRIWAISVNGIAYFEGGRWHHVRGGWQADDGTPYRLLVARDGTLWIATSRALLFVRPGESVVQRTSLDVHEAWELAQAPDGRLWLSDLEHGTRPIQPQPGEPPKPDGSASIKHTLVARRMLFDTAGNLWAVLETQPGLVLIARPDRVPTGTALSERDVTQAYREPINLTSNFAGPLLEDRQGIVWAGTSFGLDEFLPSNFTVRPEFSTVPIHGFRALDAANGTLAVADDDTIRIYARDGSMLSHFNTSGAPSGLCANSAGTFMLASNEGLGQVGTKGLSPVSLPEGLHSRIMVSCQFDRADGLWVLTRDDGLYLRRGGQWRRVVPQEAIGTPWPRVLLIDERDRVWLGADGGGMNLLVGGRLMHIASSMGLDVGQVHTAIAVPGGVLFGGESGLAFYNGHRFRSVSQTRAPSLNVVTGLALDSHGDLWISGTRGIAVFAHETLPDLFGGKTTPSPRQFNYRRELPGFSQLNCCANTIVPAPMDHLWLLTNKAVASVDPHHLHFRNPSVTVHIRSAASSNRALPIHGPVTLQAGNPNLQIEYTADSLADADQIEFRYRLEGLDSEWVEAGGTKQTYYSSLAHGHYRFVVQARRSGSDWSEQDATLEVTVPPTFWQTPLPKILAGLIVLALAGTTLWLRWRITVRLLEERVEERASERERVARDVHDTLLQSFQGLILRMEVISHRFVKDPATYRDMRQVLERADHVLLEGRTKIEGLRGSRKHQDLASAILAAIFDYQAMSPHVSLSSSVSGTPQAIDPLIQDELCQIAREALTNAFRHANARNIEIAISFRAFLLEIVMTDDGKGFTPDATAFPDDHGHYGIIGMKERALRIHAAMSIISAPGEGTVVRVTCSTGSFMGKVYGRIANFCRTLRTGFHNYVLRRRGGNQLLNIGKRPEQAEGLDR